MKKLVLCLVERKFSGDKKTLCSEKCPFLEQKDGQEKCSLFNRRLFRNYSSYVKTWNRCDKCLTYEM